MLSPAPSFISLIIRELIKKSGNSGLSSFFHLMNFSFSGHKLYKTSEDEGRVFNPSFKDSSTLRVSKITHIKYTSHKQEKYNRYI